MEVLLNGLAWYNSGTIDVILGTLVKVNDLDHSIVAALKHSPLLSTRIKLVAEDPVVGTCHNLVSRLQRHFLVCGCQDALDSIVANGVD